MTQTSVVRDPLSANHPGFRARNPRYEHPQDFLIHAMQDRGGWRWAFLSLEQEQTLLATAMEEAQRGRALTAKQLLLKLQEVVAQQVVREYLYRFVALCPFDGQFACLTLPLPRADTCTMNIFLVHTAAEFPNQFCLMLVDGAGWHTAGNLKVPPTIRLLPLPPYSPELHPVEHIWEDLRENDFRNDVMKSLDAVADRLGQGLRRQAADPGYVQNLTCFDWIRTIRMM